MSVIQRTGPAKEAVRTPSFFVEISTKSTIHVGKYTSPMDGMGKNDFAGSLH